MKGVNPKALVTTNQLALSLLGGIVVSLLKLKPIEHALTQPFTKTNPSSIKCF